MTRNSHHLPLALAGLSMGALAMHRGVSLALLGGAWATSIYNEPRWS